MAPREPCSVAAETLDRHAGNWFGSQSPVAWRCLFTSPAWLRAWWEVFGGGSDLRLLAVRQAGKTIGMAPLAIEANAARFIGSPDVCDYLDFAIADGQETMFFDTLLPYLRREGVERLDLWPLHPGSTVLQTSTHLADQLGCSISLEPDEAVFEMPLPSTWEAFLSRLSGKERHEVRRKLRRLSDAGEIGFRDVGGPHQLADAMDLFLKLFQSNRRDKSAFMTDRMVSFFRALAAAMAQAGVLKLSFLELDGTAVAAVMCFDYRSTVYLYNNGYDSRFGSLSVGMLSKVLSIRECIQSGKKTYSFLKGEEAYKRRLGGVRVQLHRCRIDL